MKNIGELAAIASMMGAQSTADAKFVRTDTCLKPKDYGQWLQQTGRQKWVKAKRFKGK
jgi:hypothetical protein